MNKTKLFIITILAISVLAIPVEASTINYNASDCRKIVMKKGTKAKVTNTGWKKFKIKVSDRKVVKVVKNGTIKAIKKVKVKVKLIKDKEVKKITVVVKKNTVDANTKTVKATVNKQDEHINTVINNTSDKLLQINTNGIIEKLENNQWKSVGLKEAIVSSSPYVYVAAGKNYTINKPINIYNIASSGTYRITFNCKIMETGEKLQISEKFEVK